MNRLGAVRACQENAQRLLAEDKTVAVFPEGAKGIGKLFAQRYKLQRFGRGGFIRLALRTGTPLRPVRDRRRRGGVNPDPRALRRRVEVARSPLLPGHADLPAARSRRVSCPRRRSGGSASASG